MPKHISWSRLCIIHVLPLLLLWVICLGQPFLFYVILLSDCDSPNSLTSVRCHAVYYGTTYTLYDNLNLTCLLMGFTFGGTQYQSFWSTNAVLTFWISCALNTDVCVCVCVHGLSHFSHVWLFSTLWTIACQPPLGPGNSPGRNIGVGCYFLLHRIFLTKRSNSFLPHWQTDSLLLSHKGRPVTYLLFIM